VRRRGETGGEIWIVVADMMLGFLAVVLLTALRHERLSQAYPAPTSTPTPTLTPSASPVSGTFRAPPPAVENFLQELLSLQTRQHFLIAPPRYAEVYIIFQSELLFPKCQWTLTDAGRQSLKDQACVLWKFNESIERIEIEGYSDPRPADDCFSLQQLKGIELPADNLLLSSFRAIAVRNELAKMAGATSGETSASATPETHGEAASEAGSGWSR
jgi:hypothetical protein